MHRVLPDINRSHQKIKLCGRNENCQLGVESNSKDVLGEPSVNPPLDPDFDFSAISSYSIYSDHAIAITYDGEMYDICDNEDSYYSGSFNNKMTKFEIKDSKGLKWNPISAVCYDAYTVFLVSNPNDSNETKLFYKSSNEKSCFINVKQSKPVAIFGGSLIPFAIDEDGAIIYIPPDIHRYPSTEIKPIKLPNEKKAVKIIRFNKYVLVLTLDGEVYELKSITNKPKFNLFSNGGKIVDISGSNDHCLIVSNDGLVFGMGNNTNGQLGIGTNALFVKEFTEITPLNKYKIKAAYAGENHSLFLTEEGKILGCGSNPCGELPGVKISANPYLDPVETSITEGATFCIAGDNLSAIFFGPVPPNTPNQKIIFKESVPDEEESEIEKLKAEISRLQKENESLRAKSKKSDTSKSTTKGRTQNTIEIIDQETIDSMERLGQIGSGDQSEVFKVSRPQEFALKVLKLSQKPENQSENIRNMKRFLQEGEILNLLNHPNIVKSYGFCFGNETNSPSILMQHCPNNLKEIIESLNSMQQICVIFEISSAMEAVHAANLIHRDLKPENILIDKDGHVRLSDFSCSCIIDVEFQSQTSDFRSIKFMAPELLNETADYGNKVDVYSFGVVVFFVLTKGQYPKISIADQSNGKIAKIPESINSVSRDLIERCWSKDPNDRPSFTEIIEFIKENDFKLIDGIKSKLNQIKSFLSLI